MFRVTKVAIILQKVPFRRCVSLPQVPKKAFLPLSGRTPSYSLSLYVTLWSSGVFDLGSEILIDGLVLLSSISPPPAITSSIVGQRVADTPLSNLSGASVFQAIFTPCGLRWLRFKLGFCRSIRASDQPQPASYPPRWW